jgi:TatD DNase family protein
LRGLVDCHAHLDLLDDPREAVREAAAVGVDNIITVGIDIESCRKTVLLANELDGVLASVGIHPHSAASVQDDHFQELEVMASEECVVAIGETGLDFYRDSSPRESQMEILRRHIDLARATDLPLIVHSREAATETLTVLGERAKGLTVILHCFALYEQVELCAERGYFMSVAGNVTFKNAARLRASISLMPPELVLTETDSPYLAPMPYRGKQNKPAYAGHVLSAIAELKERPEKEVQEMVLANFQRAFRIRP